MDVAALEQHMADVLYETARILFPLASDLRNLIKSHVWRDRKYLGEVNGKVATWKGFSANLVQIDFRYRAIFLDLVQNVLPVHKRHQLFGPAFTEHTLNYEQFVVMFVLDFPLNSEAEIIAQGFVPRRMQRGLHACEIASPEEFLSQSVFHWAGKVARLVLLQRLLSIHRKPLDADEVPFQHLLYRTGYLHSYIVTGGLELHYLTEPRRAGDFGHDFHAVVANPRRAGSFPFSLGIEVFSGAIGYHIDSIPNYVNHFDLTGMIVVAKDDPLPELLEVQGKFRRPLSPERKLSAIGTRNEIGINHLPLDDVIYDLLTIQDEIGGLLASK
jgi:hypothetical protein